MDKREHKRIPEILKYYDKQENITSTTPTMLETGDFIFYDKRGAVVFEWKTVSDFIHSIRDARVFNQSINMYEEFTYSFVIIVGTEKEKLEAFYFEGIHDKAYYSAIAKLNTYVTVLTAPDNKSAYQLMSIQAEKCLNDEFVYKRLNIKSPNPAQNLLLLCKHIGEDTAVRITTELGLTTFNDLANVSYEELTSIKGIGQKTAERIIGYIGETIT